MANPSFSVGNRVIGSAYRPFVIAEIGINHGGDINKAKRMVDDALAAGCECVKMQYHILEEEMVKNDVIPGNSDQSIWDIISESNLTHADHCELKEYIESKGLIYLSTPFSICAADRLNNMGVKFFKIGSGECNNYPLIDHVAKFKKPMIISTGMNDMESIQRTVEIVTKYQVPYALMHCTSIYPTPYPLVKLHCITQLKEKFPGAIIGLSDHSLGNYTCFGAVALGASILEKHFTSTYSWSGPDIAISILPAELSELVKGSDAIYQSCIGEDKVILSEEYPTIQFAYSSAVSVRDIQPGEVLNEANVAFKRPGTGDFLAKDWNKVYGKKAVRLIKGNSILKKAMVE